MATVVNFIDTTLQAAATRTVNLPTAQVLLPPSAFFHVTTAGVGSPTSITFTPTLKDLAGTISFTCTGGTLTNVTATSADLTYANMSASIATVTASVTVNGSTYTTLCTVSKVQDGTSGLNTAIIYAYQRASASPSGSPGDVTYDFTSKTITTSTLANSWQKTIPTANGYPLYVTAATASGPGTTDTIVSAEWAGAVVLAQDGPGGTGTNGLNTATATIYQRSTTSTAPALPSAAATYNFGASTPLTGLNNGWSPSVPALSGGPYLFVSTATASSASGSDSIPASEWAAATLLLDAISLGADGTLSGSGGGQATLSGMGQKTFRVVAQGNASTTTPVGAGIYKDGTLQVGETQSYTVVLITRSTGAIYTSLTYDVYGAGALTSGRDAGSMAAFLNSVASGTYIVVVYSAVEPQTNRLTAGLAAAMYRHGASRVVYGSANFQYMSAYILVGISGCGEGNGAEAYQGSVASDTNAWCDIGFNLLNGVLTGVSTSYTPKSLTDYGYIGDLNATVGAPSGTNVAGVPADTLVSQAAAGNTASTTLNSPPVISSISNVTATNVYKPAVTIATKTPSVSAGVGPFTFDWRAENITVGDVDITYTVSTVTNTNDKNTIKAISQVTGGLPSQDLVTVTATDAKGRVSITQFTVNASC